MRTRALLLALAVLAAPARLAGQECEVVRNQSINITNPNTDREVAHVVTADIACPNGRRIFADNATIFTSSGIVDLRGNVRFSDPERTLTANQAQYDRINQRLYATGDVRVRHIASGSTLFSDALTYEQEMEGREARLQAHPGGRRPHAVLFRERREGGLALDPRRGGTPRDSTLVDADMIEVIGERFFHAVGDAVLTRDSVRATGGVIDYTQDTGALVVARSAHVEGPTYDLYGDTVRAELQGDSLRAVHARINGRLETEEVQVLAPIIDIELKAGMVERMIAVLPPDQRGPGSPLARVDARRFRLAADSIEVLAPAQELEEVVAVGRAFGEMVDTAARVAAVPADSLAGDEPADTTALASARQLEAEIGNDYMRGDTLHAFFIANPAAASDTTADPRVLERLVAGGTPAAALYRKRTAGPGGVPGTGAPEVGYVLANVIEVRLTDGEVSDVKAEGEVRGMYLQPRNGAAVGQAGARAP